MEPASAPTFPMSLLFQGARGPFTGVYAGRVLGAVYVTVGPVAASTIAPSRAVSRLTRSTGPSRLSASVAASLFAAPSGFAARFGLAPPLSQEPTNPVAAI